MDKLKTAAVILGFVVSGVIFACSKSEDTSVSEEETFVLEREETEALQPVSETSLQTKVLVHVCGEVKRPDVYELDGDMRVFDAVRAAGGFTENAAEDYLNLAEPLADGEKIYVPSGEEVTAGELDPAGGIQTGGISSGDGKVNINTATAEELKTLSGIGDARANDIIRYREVNGKFEEPEDIMLVPGIKNAAYSKICNDIKV